MHRITLVLVLATLDAKISGCRSVEYSVRPIGCQLPEYPAHGTYAVSRVPSARPGQIIESVLLRYKCNHGYGIYGLNEIFCVRGLWSMPFPTCVRFCKLRKGAGVEHTCFETENNQITRPCYDYEPVGEHVKVNCKAGYHGMQDIAFITCRNNATWDHEAMCVPDKPAHWRNSSVDYSDPWKKAVTPTDQVLYDFHYEEEHVVKMGDGIERRSYQNRHISGRNISGNTDLTYTIERKFA